MDLFGMALIACIIVLIFLPTRFDPAIRWKEYNERKHRSRRK